MNDTKVLMGLIHATNMMAVQPDPEHGPDHLLNQWVQRDLIERTSLREERVRPVGVVSFIPKCRHCTAQHKLTSPLIILPEQYQNQRKS